MKPLTLYYCAVSSPLLNLEIKSNYKPSRTCIFKGTILSIDLTSDDQDFKNMKLRKQVKGVYTVI